MPDLSNECSTVKRASSIRVVGLNNYIEKYLFVTYDLITQQESLHSWLKRPWFGPRFRLGLYSRLGVGPDRRCARCWGPRRRRRICLPFWAESCARLRPSSGMDAKHRSNFRIQFLNLFEVKIIITVRLVHRIRIDIVCPDNKTLLALRFLMIFVRLTNHTIQMRPHCQGLIETIIAIKIVFC